MKLTSQTNACSDNQWLSKNDGDSVTQIFKLFEHINLSCSYGFTNNLSDDKIIELEKFWAKSLFEHKITYAEARRGLEEMLKTGKRKWRIDYMEFYELCRPPPNYSSLFGEALNQMNKRRFGRDKWDNPAIYHAYMKIGDFEMRRTTYNQIKQKWKSTLDDCIAARPIMPVPPAELRKALPIIRNKKTAGLGIAAMRKTLAEGRRPSAHV